ncbi:MAG: tyrosine-type recombinase/integrase [Candidatus Aenigmarchaeota archaeon]|nr:tyrosine-type recombinase/integrase [Candidatus Aenigmarchaeota archaeon]
MENQELLDKLLREMRIRGFSQRTIKSYFLYNKHLINFTKKNALEITEDDIKNYLDFLLTQKKVKKVTLNHVISALKFFYDSLLEKTIFLRIKRPHRERTIPTILTKEEVKKMIDYTDNKKHKLLIKFTYATGLRVSELVRLKIENLDLKEGLVYVRAGKGSKDRVVPIPKILVDELMEYLISRKDENIYLFPSFKANHLSKRSAEKIISRAAEKARINKWVTVHTLRHSFATHLLNAGTDIRFIQKLLGHKRLTSTEIYTHLTTEDLKRIKNPLEYL